jgi:hypothetical protein
MTESWNGRERRSRPRVECQGPSSLIFNENTFVFCTTQDVSDSGASVQLPGSYRMRVGERFTLTARCIEAGPVEAIVVRQNDNIMGCRFP